MTARIPGPPAPGLLEDWAAQFDDLFTHAAQRRNVRENLADVLSRRDRNKTLTALAGADRGVRGRRRAGAVGGRLVLAACAAARAGLARPADHALALLAYLVAGAPAARAPRTA